VNRVGDLIPWRVTDISFRPFKGMWSLNPSIHFDGSIWRCALRCADYAMPNGVTIRSDRARDGQARTKNALVIFDPKDWRPLEIYKMREHDRLPRAETDSWGFEDIRLFRTDQGDLQGIAASLHLQRPGRSRKQLPEQVLLSFGADYDIVDAQPIRGEAWSTTAQKNWAPFDGCAAPRFLHSIFTGRLFDGRGELLDGEDGVRGADRSHGRPHAPGGSARERAKERALENMQVRSRNERERERHVHRVLEAPALDHRVCEGLRGGTQLVRVSDDTWLGLGHEMSLVRNRKFYWHVWYLVNAKGKLIAASERMKLVTNGIEFAAGLALDGDRVVVSYGVDDMEARLGETSLAAVMALLRPISEAL
jgi:hypothetical protein